MMLPGAVRARASSPPLFAPPLPACARRPPCQARCFAELCGKRRIRAVLEEMSERHDEHEIEDSAAVAALVREEIARRRITRATLAHEARISLSTLEKALSGQRAFTLATLVRLEEALGRPLRQARPPAAATTAPVALGGYSRPAVAWLEGDYLTLRPAFTVADGIVSYRTSITWEEPRLVFRESERRDAAYSQRGEVSVSSLSGHIYFVTNADGQHRMALVSRPTISGEMYGIITTLLAGRGAHLTPLSAPVAFLPLKGIEAPEYGLIEAGSASHPRYREHLRRVREDGFAIFL